MGLAAQGGRDAAPTAVLPARLPQPPGPPRPAPVPSVRPGARAGRCRARGVRGTRGCPGHLRRVRARERGPGHGAGGRGGGRTARAGEFWEAAPAPAAPSTPSDGRAAAGAAPSHPHLLCGAPTRSPRLSPRGMGTSGCGAPPVGPGAQGACGAFTCQRERRVRARPSRGREEVPGGSGGQFPRKNLPHSLNVNDSKRGVLPLH